MTVTFLYERKKRKKETAMAEERAYTEEIAAGLIDIVGEEACLEHESMKKHTTFRIGGEADVFVMPRREEELSYVLAYCRQSAVRHAVIGNGSNLLVSDRGYRGVIIQIAKNLSGIRVEDCEIEAQAGALLSSIARRAMESSLTGMEALSGIPGTLGGALTMNAGAYGTEMKDIVRSVRVLDEEGRIRELSCEEMEFAYRTSVAQRENMIILSACLVLQNGEKEQIQRAMDELRERRQSKQPLELPSAGSTFKRPEGYYAGALIEQAGLRGYREGGAQVSEKHCGFVVNTGGATAEDVLRLIHAVQDAVYENAGVRLEPEVRMLGFEDD
jgi:UDP-N-acetylmuramate dehydrogenase